MRAASSGLTATDTRRQTVTLIRYPPPRMLSSLALSAAAWADAGSFGTETPLRRRRLSCRALSGSRRGAPPHRAQALSHHSARHLQRLTADGPGVRLLLWPHATGQGRAQHVPVRGTGDAGDATRCRVCPAPLSSQSGAGSGTATCLRRRRRWQMPHRCGAASRAAFARTAALLSQQAVWPRKLTTIAKRRTQNRGNWKQNRIKRLECDIYL